MKALLSLVMFVTGLSSFAQTSSFTYQGRLNDGTAPATGSYDFQFLLRDAPAGNQVGSALTNSPVAVSNGFFTFTLDFGASAFNGAARYLEVGVRTNGSASAFSILLPRQQITSSPYAIQAANAATVSGAIADAQLSVNIPRLSGGAAFTGTVTAGSFSGNGAGVNNVNAAALGGLTTANFWKLGGNSGSNPGTDFIGTTDNQSLEFKVNNLRGLRIEPTINDATHSNIVNVVAGSPVNVVDPGVYGATISGGGALIYPGGAFVNSVAADFGTIGGGGHNTIQTNSPFATIGGGNNNNIQGSVNYSTIGGGLSNRIETNGARATIGGGESNVIETRNSYTTISGGGLNRIQASSIQSTISGGWFNSIGSNSPNATIGGGDHNKIDPQVLNAAIGGGFQNRITSGAHGSAIPGGAGNLIQSNASSSTIGGGNGNQILIGASDSMIGGGNGNVIGTNAFRSTVGGGVNNSIQSNATHATIGGGYGNIILSDGQFAMIPGGQSNQAASFAFAAGYNAQATNSGSFVWSDGTGTMTPSTSENSVTMRASGGFRFFTDIGSGGASLAAGGTSWATISDRNAKKNFQPLDKKEVLEKLTAMPVQRWNYQWEEDSGVPHIGPVAQDFKSAFYPGRDDKSITTLEFDGIELAAIQGLHQIVNEKDARISALEKQNSELEKRFNELEKLVKSLAERK